MLFTETFSGVGRATAGQLENLRRQLGVGIDPAYDYSQMTELQRKLTSKKDKKPKAQFGNGGALDQLREALKEATAPPAAEEPEEDAAADGSPRKAGAASQDAKATSKPSWVFRARDRHSLQALDVENRFRAPPLGTYRAKHDLCDPRVKGHHDFGMREPTKSRSITNLEAEVSRLKEEGQDWEHLLKPVTSVEMLPEKPEPLRRRQLCYDWAKQVDRPDMVKVANIQYNDNSFTAGVLGGDLATSKMLRQPCFDFAKMSTSPGKPQETFFQPGQYKVNIDVSRPKLEVKNLPFEKQAKRRPMCEVIGRVEVKSRAGDHLPDRSLARSCPLLQPRQQVADFSKYTDRPPPAVAKKPYHDASNPEIDRHVYQREMTHDDMAAAKATWSKPKDPGRFERSLDRQNHFKTQRSYGENVLMRMAKENTTRGPVSVELLPADSLTSSQQLNPRVLVREFDRMPSRDPEKKYAEPPMRNRDHSSAMRFGRGARNGDGRPNMEVLSPSAAEVSRKRSQRGFVGLSVGE
mmetsp:Transcript_47700/g.137347  ORF Transcript_47700/g.137347 Transcript_47700/m.137347 type:complete len:521 (+) Transcript_47700:102-1664(+)